jgi:hypothetical protein
MLTEVQGEASGPRKLVPWGITKLTAPSEDPTSVLDKMVPSDAIDAAMDVTPTSLLAVELTPVVVTVVPLPEPELTLLPPPGTMPPPELPPPELLPPPLGEVPPPLTLALITLKALLLAVASPELVAVRV